MADTARVISRLVDAIMARIAFHTTPAELVVYATVPVIIGLTDDCDHPVQTMIADVTDVDELLSGQRREGLYYGAIAFVQTAATALMVWLASLVFQWVGHKADVAQTSTALWGIRLLMSVGAAVWLVPGAVFCALMPLTKRRHAVVLRAIEARNAGEPWETDEVRAVF